MTKPEISSAGFSATYENNGSVSVEVTGTGEREAVQGTLAANITHLSPEQLAKLQAHLLKAGQDLSYFTALRRASKGKLRRVYATICHASESEVMRLVEVWV